MHEYDQQVEIERLLELRWAALVPVIFESSNMPAHAFDDHASPSSHSRRSLTFRRQGPRWVAVRRSACDWLPSLLYYLKEGGHRFRFDHIVKGALLLPRESAALARC